MIYTEQLIFSSVARLELTQSVKSPDLNVKFPFSKNWAPPKPAKREAWQEELSLGFTQDNEETPVQDTAGREQDSQSSWQRTPQKRGSLVKYDPLKTLYKDTEVRESQSSLN